MADLVWITGVVVVVALSVSVALSAKAFKTLRVCEEADRRRAGEVPISPYAAWLGGRCWVRECHGKTIVWRKCRVVAVSHKGSVCVRDWDDESGHKAVWISKKVVSRRVRFDGPGGELEGMKGDGR